MMQFPPATLIEDEAVLLQRLFAQIAALSADIAGVSRPAFSAIETATLELLASEARAAGLDAGFDAGRNLVLSLPGQHDAEPFVLLGSHVDSVPQGGNYDGLAGVLAGLLCLIRARRAGVEFPVPVKLVALRGEESTWFGPCYLGSKALLGILTPEEAASPHRGDGRSLLQHMADLGIDTARVAQGQPLLRPAAILAYLELHIEQGPVLVERNLPAAIVTGIRGNLRYKHIVVTGQEGHSGAVPGAYRHDPVLAAAALIAELDAHWQRLLARGDDIAVTVGTIGTDPLTSAISRIPDHLDFALDIRSSTTQLLDDMRLWLGEAAQRIATERGISIAFGGELTTPPALCDPAIVQALTAAQRDIGQQPYAMPSGGGHDAAVFANAGIPAGMVFVRNAGGSHNPGESMAIADLVAGVDILYAALSKGLPHA